jgi:glycosyltransferase involved in cell wall biosynthesis
MKASVIIPAFRLEPYIGPCLESVLAQETSFPFEVIVCDDKSPDGTLAAIRAVQEKYPQLRVLENDPNRGLVRTMARLLEAAQGEYIAYLDGDDLALPRKLQAQVDYLDAHPRCTLAYHESDMFDSDTGQSIKRYSQGFYNAKYIPAQATAEHLVRYGTFLQASSVMVRRHANLVGALDHGCRIICDYPWHIGNALLGGGTIDLVPGTLGRYRVHAGSFGAATNRDYARREEVTRELEAACRFGGKLGLAPEVVDAGVAHARFAAALYFLRANQEELFTRYIEESAPTNGAFFDERHAFACAHANEPAKVREHLGWVSHA